jgi:molybdenum cofactor biosynthesis protein B
VLVGLVNAPAPRTMEDTVNTVLDDVRAAGFTVVRSVVVQPEAEVIQLLVANVSNDNAADAILLIGGVGFGPLDCTCDAIDGLVHRRIEGFGDAYRQLLRDEFAAGTGALLARATAGVYHQCLVFALGGPPDRVHRAVTTLVVPTLVDAIEQATGRERA